MDDADGLALAQMDADTQSLVELQRIEDLLSAAREPLLVMISATPFERWKFKAGWRPRPDIIATRVFDTLDIDKDGSLAEGVLEVIIKHLPSSYACTKRTYEHIEVCNKLGTLT